MTRQEDDLRMLGHTFGRLTVISHAESKKAGRFWYCRCSCGEYRTVRAAALRAGRATSCGCWRRQRTREVVTKHGHNADYGTSPTYRSWTMMRQRCTNPGNTNYARYGGRGIKICKRWRTFQNFLQDMGERPTKHTLDRIDNAGNYEPNNCRWATLAEQARNTRQNFFITWAGETLCLEDWQRKTGLPLHSRLHRGWSVERALTTPKGGRDITEQEARVEMIW